MPFDSKKIMQLLGNIIINNVDLIVKKLMKKFDDDIISSEDDEDPARPSLCREEFKEFLKNTILDNIDVSITEGVIEIGIGDADKLGLGDELDEDTTDCLKIIGTILQGISGNYVLVTSEMTGGPEGRFGGAFIMPESQYRTEALTHSRWNPNKPIWKFSNFPGLPSFFEDVDLSEMINKSLQEFTRMVKR